MLLTATRRLWSRRRLMACLLLGLLSTIVVAAASVWGDWWSEDEFFTHDVRPGTPYYHPSVHRLTLARSWGRRLYTAWHTSLAKPQLIDPATTPAQARARFYAQAVEPGWLHTWWPSNAAHVMRDIQINGWPAGAFWCEHERSWPVGVDSLRGGVRLTHHRHLPLRPLPLGVAFDTVFFGAIWWIAAAVPSLVRLRRRFRSGRCPVCGYDIAGEFSAGCPECGWRRSTSIRDRLPS